MGGMPCLECLGITLDRAQNNANADTISAIGSESLVRTIQTNEDLMIARYTNELLFPSRYESSRA